jgi:hypothetical protein
MFVSAAKNTFAPVRSARASRVVARAEPINQSIKKDEPKVVDMMAVDDLPKKVRRHAVHEHTRANNIRDIARR